MHGWFTDSKFVDQSGTPLALQKSGVGSFEELAQKYSGDMPRRALLDELVAGGMVALNEETIRPLRRHYFFETGRHTPDLESLSIDLDVIFRSSEPAAKSTGAELRRISIQLPNDTTPSIQRTINIRTERFLEALSDYLYSNATPPREDKNSSDNVGTTFHLIVAQCKTSKANEKE